MIVVLACAPVGTVTAPGARAAGMFPAARSVGYDVSWPNCGMPEPTQRFAVVGVTGGLPFTANPCLAAEFGAARRTGVAQLYMNIAATGRTTARLGRTGPAGSCAPSASMCTAYNYGYAAARAAYSLARSRLGASAVRTTWWLDVEFGANWSSSPPVNARAVAGALAFLRGRGLPVGIYSTAYQWSHIAGRFRPGVPTWYATVTRSAAAARHACTASRGFTGGIVRMVQFAPGGLDADTVC